MSYQVTMKAVEARPTAVVEAVTTWQEFPTLWRELSMGRHKSGLLTLVPQRLTEMIPTWILLSLIPV